MGAGFCGISMIQHTVSFRLKHPKGSEAEAAFMAALQGLRVLPGVLEFRVLKQVSPKNDFDYGLSMYFSSQETYDGYDAHPTHQRFVNEIWLQEVEDFLEIDYVEHATV